MRKSDRGREEQRGKKERRQEGVKKTSEVEQEGRRRARLQTDVQLFHRLKKAGVSSTWRETERGMKQERERDCSCKKKRGNGQMERESLQQGRRRESSV